jgi:transposase
VSSYTNPPDLEPPDHTIGRSRGDLTSKIHLISDGRGRPLSLIVTPANINDTTMLSAVIDAIRVPRTGPGRTRTRPTVVIADKGYPSRANR